jgi:transposase InsO family protein
MGASRSAGCCVDRLNPPSFEAVEYVTLTWVDWFNNRRIMEPIGNMPPAEAEAEYYAMLENQPMAA